LGAYATAGHILSPKNAISPVGFNPGSLASEIVYFFWTNIGLKVSLFIGWKMF
jgi:hypothetical protein